MTETDPATRRRGGEEPDSWGLGYNQVVGKRTMPFIMQVVNRRIVQRSNALLGHSYGAPDPASSSQYTHYGCSGRHINTCMARKMMCCKWRVSYSPHIGYGYVKQAMTSSTQKLCKLLVF